MGDMQDAFNSATNSTLRAVHDSDRKQPTEALDVVLKDRGTKYGEFRNHAIIAQDIKDIMRSCGMDRGRMQAFQVEALEMIAHKIGRILNGDPNYADSWIDIAGYAKLVADRLEQK